MPLFTGVVDDQNGIADSFGGVPGPLGIKRETTGNCNHFSRNDLLQNDDNLTASGKRTDGTASHVVSSRDARDALPLDFIARVWNDLPPHVRETVGTFVDAIVSRRVPI
jgi:hypothetical protein